MKGFPWITTPGTPKPTPGTPKTTPGLAFPGTIRGRSEVGRDTFNVGILGDLLLFLHPRLDP